MSDQPDEFLSEEEILDFDDIREETLLVPEWGNKKVRVRGLTLSEMATLANKATRRDPRTSTDVVDREIVMMLTLVYGMVHPKIRPENMARLKAKSAGAVTRIVAAINSFGATQDAIDDATKSDAPELNGSVPVLLGPRAKKDAP